MMELLHDRESQLDEVLPEISDDVLVLSITQVVSHAGKWQFKKREDLDQILDCCSVLE